MHQSKSIKLGICYDICRRSYLTAQPKASNCCTSTTETEVIAVSERQPKMYNLALQTDSGHSELEGNSHTSNGQQSCSKVVTQVNICHQTSHKLSSKDKEHRNKTLFCVQKSLRGEIKCETSFN
ncbi:hypothetical protein TNCV_2970451 [Trichonephila clavipes]|nr:hypothetical protein TNCV_2970451 [Trichonephila clavipes]